MAALLLFCAPVILRAQRALHWDALDVDAQLDAEGILHVTETQTMVFTGDWNGGERTFNVRAGQTIRAISVQRLDTATGERHQLYFDDSLDEVDEVSLQGTRLRWRSRLPSDKPFANDRLTYVITYRQSGILRRQDDRYVLDHDFAFPDRTGAIAHFSLRLAFDPVWQPLSGVRERYTAGPLAPGRSFVLTLPLRYSGAGSPVAIDTRPTPQIRAAVAGIFVASALLIAGFFVRESRLGRFASVSRHAVDTEWIKTNVLTLPAEVVGAAWDDAVGPPEVVALIARMVGEGKLSSETAASGSLTLRLNVNRDSLDGYERALVDALFFGGRTVTSTDEVKAHYQSTGFDPAKVIAPQLQARVEQLLPPRQAPRLSRRWSVLVYLSAAAVLVYDAQFAVVLGAVIAAVFAEVPGRLFRQHIEWAAGAAVLCVIPAVLVAAAAAAMLWFAPGSALELSPLSVATVTLLAVWIVYRSLSGLKSRQNRDAIAFRKKLAAARQFFASQLWQPRPSLDDSWYPWVLAFGLANRWSPPFAAASDRTPERERSTDSLSASSTGTWSGFAGGRSGGAGGGATWAAAAAGLAAGVTAPSSDSDSGGGSSDSGGSSGGGGGGGW